MNDKQQTERSKEESRLIAINITQDGWAMYTPEEFSELSDKIADMHAMTGSTKGYSCGYYDGANGFARRENLFAEIKVPFITGIAEWDTLVSREKSKLDRMVTDKEPIVTGFLLMTGRSRIPKADFYRILYRIAMGAARAGMLKGYVQGYNDAVAGKPKDAHPEEIGRIIGRFVNVTNAPRYPRWQMKPIKTIKEDPTLRQPAEWASALDKQA